MEQRQLKFRSFDDGKMLTMPLNTNFGISRFFGMLRDDAIVMQFTGLKDANDKEVYEGDILREAPKNDWEETNYSCFEVFFHDGDANSDYNIGFTMNRMHNHGSVCGGYIPSFKPKSLKKMCVIGNIYENSELLSERS
jgi:uncharacterized phage protein (TIGR01671 family)